MNETIIKMMIRYFTEQAGIFRVRGDKEKHLFFLKKRAEFVLKLKSCKVDIK